MPNKNEQCHLNNAQNKKQQAENKKQQGAENKGNQNSCK